MKWSKWIQIKRNIHVWRVPEFGDMYNSYKNGVREKKYSCSGSPLCALQPRCWVTWSHFHRLCGGLRCLGCIARACGARSLCFFFSVRDLLELYLNVGSGAREKEVYSNVTGRRYEIWFEYKTNRTTARFWIKIHHWTKPKSV